MGHARSARKWYDANRHKVRSQMRVGAEIRSGRMSRRPCMVCGRPDGQAHHAWGYDSALRVMFLCPPHHKPADLDSDRNDELKELHSFVDSI